MKVLSSSHRPAFTLTELLVVIAIIAILASMLLPVLSRSKAASRTTACKNQLRQMGLALNLYSEDFGAFPFLSVDPTAANVLGRVPVQLWHTALSPYMGNRSSNIYTWPTCLEKDTRGVLGTYGYNADGIEPGGTLSHVSWGLGGSIAMDVPAGWPYASTPASRVVSPSQMIALGDRSLAGLPANGFYWGAITTSSILNWEWPGISHSGGANMVFCDAHVEWAKQTNWVAATIPARSRWNNDNQPHRESW